MVKDLLTRVSDIYQKLLSKLLAPLSMPEHPQPNEKAKPKASSLSRNRKASKKK